MEDKRLQILVSAVDRDCNNLVRSMNLQSDAIIVDQIIRTRDRHQFLPSDRQILHGVFNIKVMERAEKGVGLSRNTCLLASDHEIVQFGDDDILYHDGYVRLVLKEFDDHPEADVILFNVKAQEGRETYWNNDFARVSWRNYGRYPAYAICARRQKLMDSGIRYSLLFGGGAPYMNGEDSLFLHDCLEKKLKVYRSPVYIGDEKRGDSTWFKGYDDKFFFDRGVLYHFLYKAMAPVFGFRFLFKNRKTMCRDMGLMKSYKLLLEGVAKGKTIKKV